MKLSNENTHLLLGQQGEDLVVKHLVKLNFQILDRNYRKKWGELDIVAKSLDKDRNKKILHFVEVKTVSCETRFEDNQPEENMHFQKRKRMARAIQTYLAQHPPAKESDEIDFQIDIAAVFLNLETGESKIRITENIIL